MSPVKRSPLPDKPKKTLAAEMKKNSRSMIVAGIMSGTSADGVNVAIVRIAPERGRPTLKLLDHDAFDFSDELREKILAAMNAPSISTAELARLNWRLGLEYAKALKQVTSRHKFAVELVGCHGQTLYHQPAKEHYAGEEFACTWQLGEAQAITAALQIPVVSNFRPADMFAGGQGAPLVPLLDYVLFASPKHGRVLQNIGGIANLTAIPAGGGPQSLIAFDTGPGNMVMDWLAQTLFGQPFDRNGSYAASGAVIQPVLSSMLDLPYFNVQPPRTAGREQFGREFAEAFLASCREHSAKPEDAIATATALTAASIAHGYATFVHDQLKGGPIDFIVSGGGAKNAELMQMLTLLLEPFGCTVKDSDAFGLPSDAKEAAAFALLAWKTWHHLPGNVPAATGAERAVILGQVTYA